MRFVFFLCLICFTYVFISTALADTMAFTITPELDRAVAADNGTVQTKTPSHRGILDILENFRLWQIERKKENPGPSTAPTPAPTGIDLLLPRLPEIKLNRDTLKNIVGAGEDIAKSFVGPPPTEPEESIDNSLNISTTIPPNDFLCLFC